MFIAHDYTFYHVCFAFEEYSIAVCDNYQKRRSVEKGAVSQLSPPLLPQDVLLKVSSTKLYTSFRVAEMLAPTSLNQSILD